MQHRIPARPGLYLQLCQAKGYSIIDYQFNLSALFSSTCTPCCSIPSLSTQETTQCPDCHQQINPHALFYDPYMAQLPRGLVRINLDTRRFTRLSSLDCVRWEDLPYLPEIQISHSKLAPGPSHMPFSLLALQQLHDSRVLPQPGNYCKIHVQKRRDYSGLSPHLVPAQDSLVLLFDDKSPIIVPGPAKWIKSAFFNPFLCLLCRPDDESFTYLFAFQLSSPNQDKLILLGRALAGEGADWEMSIQGSQVYVASASKQEARVIIRKANLIEERLQFQEQSLESDGVQHPLIYYLRGDFKHSQRDTNDDLL